MIITPSRLKTIRAFFTLTIGAIITRDWKLKLHNGVYSISAPYKQFTNKNSNYQNEPLVEVLDPKITETILKLALDEYNFRKGGIENADATI